MKTLLDCIRVLEDPDTTPLPAGSLITLATALCEASGEDDLKGTLQFSAELLRQVFRLAVRRELPLVEAMAELITSQQAGVEPDFAKVLEQHAPGEVAQPQDVFAQLERKWLEKHPRRWNALTPQSQQLLETMVDALLEKTTAVEAEKTLVVLRDIYDTFTRGEETQP